MGKYIDSEKLIAKIKELNLATKTYDEQVAFNNALAMVVEIITSLQQEQKEIDLEGEITHFLSNATKMNKGEWRGKYPISDIGFRAVARHFYELGLRRAAEMYDEIEYNRQRANEEFSEKVCQ